ncbi:hypothetical protein JTB14_009619 [Gonioctena quinquepunctata]|nr:hypothetical protein JTB14_009619 [Gonioctena quinquepunctata]
MDASKSTKTKLPKLLDRPETDIENGVVQQIENFDKPGASHQPQNTSPTQVNFPEMIRLYPKAAPRKTKGGRKTGRTRILTDTPEKNAMEMEHLERLAKKSENKVQKVTKKVFAESSDDDESEIHLQDSSDEDGYLEKIVEESIEIGKERGIENSTIFGR